jgi:hypothetical protein
MGEEGMKNPLKFEENPVSFHFVVKKPQSPARKLLFLILHRNKPPGHKGKYEIKHSLQIACHLKIGHSASFNETSNWNPQDL